MHRRNSLTLGYNAALFKVAASNDWNLNVIDIELDEYITINSAQNSTTPPPHLNLTSTEFARFYDRQIVSQGDLYLFIDRIGFPISKQYNHYLSPADLRTELNQSTSYVLNDSFGWIHFPLSREGDFEISAHVALAFSRDVSQQSRLQVSLYFMVIVIIFNVFKLAVMTLVLITDRSSYLVIFGNAVASFLKWPDSHTETQCMLGKEEFCVKLGLLPLHPISTMEEAVDLDRRSHGIWLPRPRQYFFSINRHDKVIFTML